MLQDGICRHAICASSRSQSTERGGLADRAVSSDDSRCFHLGLRRVVTPRRPASERTLRDRELDRSVQTVSRPPRRWADGPAGSSGELEAVRTAGHITERSDLAPRPRPSTDTEGTVGSVLGAPCAAAARLAATDPLANQVNTLPSIGADCQIAIRPDLSGQVLREHSRPGLIVDALRHETRIAVER